jgi:micrococcal nuclease
MIPKMKSLLFLLTITLGLNLTGCSNEDIYKYSEQNTVVSNVTDTETTSDNDELEESIVEDPLNTEQETKSDLAYNIPNNARKGIVIDSIDGDTVKVKFENGDIESIRILLINTPEKDEKFGCEASNFSYKELNNKTVYIEPDVEYRDKYDRLLGYVWYEKDGQLKLYNKEIILASLAKVAYVYDSKKHLDILNEAEERVKYNRLDIWEKEGYATNKGDKYDMSVYEAKVPISNQSNSPNNSKDIVYTTRTGSKYHFNKKCKGLSSASKIFESTKQEAVNEGLGLCGYED